MADASRFPSLALPFAITGGAAGYLSASLLRNPLVGYHVHVETAAAVAAGVALLVGMIVRNLCIGRRYDYEIGDPDPDARASTDRWALHALVVILGGGVAGAITAISTEDTRYVHGFAVTGAGCAIVFVPICLAVAAAGRRAQRARHGSIVAAADRRAVWGILAVTLAAATLEALPDWPGFADLETPPPIVAIAMVIAAGLAVLWILRADHRALSEARAVIGDGLTARDPATSGEIAPSATRVDLGLGDDVLERVAHGAAAYRDRARTVALVQGNPDDTLAALAGATRRGRLSLAALLAVVLAHAAAATSFANLIYDDSRCTGGNRQACRIAARLIRDSNPARARIFQWRAGQTW